MSAVRRVYVYLLALVGLATLALGIANLGRVLVQVLEVQPLASPDFVRREVAQWGAAALVALPVWALHWRWAQRSAARPGAAEERASTLRRLYLYAALAGGVGAAGSAMHALLREGLVLLTQARPLESHPLEALPWLLVGAVVAVYHRHVAARDRAAVGEHGGSATLRRWYVYGAAFVGLLLCLGGARQLLELLWRAVASGAQRVDTLGLPDGAASALVGLGLWLLHWGPLAEARLLGPEVVGQDRRATLRSAYLFLALAWVVGGTLGGVSQLLYYGLARALGVERPGGVGGDLALAAAGPGSLALVYGVGWGYQRSALREQAREAEAGRQAGVRRLYTYLVALVALLALAGGVGGLLWTLTDLLTGAGAGTSSGQVRDQVAQFATLALVGLAVWLLHWRPSGALSVAEAQALSRRLYTYLALIGGTLGLLGSAAVAGAQVLDLALGAPAGEPLRTNLAHAGSVAVIAATLVAYHWQSLRADTRRAATARVFTHPGPPPSVTSVADAAAPPLANDRVAAPATLLVKLRAPDAGTLADALAALGERGVEVEIVAETDGS